MTFVRVGYLFIIYLVLKSKSFAYFLYLQLICQDIFKIVYKSYFLKSHQFNDYNDLVLENNIL